jgi:hypothetical protein
VTNTRMSDLLALIARRWGRGTTAKRAVIGKIFIPRG